MANQTLQELSRHSINISKHEDTIISWHKSMLSVLSEKGLHFFEISHNLQCLDKKLDFIHSFIGSPKSSPTASLFTDRILNKDLRNVDLTEMIVDQVMWPHNAQLMQEMASIVAFNWSPIGLKDNYDSAFAVLTNVGVVEMYVQYGNTWMRLFEISALLCDQYMIGISKPRSFDKLKEIVYSLASTAMVWSPSLNEDNSCYFATAQKNGSITLWLIQCHKTNVSAQFIGTFETESCEFVSILWIPKTDGKFLLVCSNILGQIIALECHLSNNIIQLLQSHILWSHKDRIITKHLQYVKINNKILLICNKHRHLLVLLLDEECKVASQYINNINDYRITSICQSSDGMHVTTVNCKVYIVNFSLIGNNIVANHALREVRELTSTYELYSISFSQNMTICSLAVVDRKVNCKKTPLKIEILFMSTKDRLDSLVETLLVNPTKQLTNYWDVIEVLRYKTMKAKEVLLVNYQQLYEAASSDLYKLKVYLILSTFCMNLKKMCKLSCEFVLPEESLEVIKEEILIAHADGLIRDFYKKVLEEGKLNDFQADSFVGAKKFLAYFLQKSDRNISDVIEPYILNVIDSNYIYICQCCDEEVAGFTCINNHLNMFCSLTFTPILGDKYLTCRWCNFTARLDLYYERPLCLFCDDNLQLVN